MGKLVAKRYEQYKWSPESLALFPGREELAEAFRQTGLQQVQAYPLTGGIPYILGSRRIWMFKKIGTYLEMIKVEHTLFALPFAFMGAILGSAVVLTNYHHGEISGGFFLPCSVHARSD